jgi:chromosome segregation ATPase
VLQQPVAQWPVEPRPSLWIAAPGGHEEWQPLAEEISRLTAQLEELNQRLLPRADEAAPEVTAELQANLRELHEVSDVADALHRELGIEVDQVRSLDSRIAALEDDVRRSQDAETLHRMGAPLTAVTPPDCPTCHQELTSTLLDPASAIVAMPIESNIQLLKEQIDLFQAMRSDLDSAIAAKRQQMVTFDERVRALQQTVRAQRETLVSASGTPSITDVEARVHLRDRVEALTNVVGRLASLNTALAQMARTWSGLLAQQAQLRDQGTPDADRAKINALQASFLDQLRDYGFTSVPISELTISEDT